MAIKKSAHFVVLFLVVGFIGYGSIEAFHQMNPISPPAVQAAALLPGCDLNGGCNGTYNLPWGYCQWSTYQTAKTFIVTLEVGINSGNVSDACELPFALGGGIITSIDGNSSYTPWAVNTASMFLNVRACSSNTCSYPTQQEHLLAHKYTAKTYPQTIPFSRHLETPLLATAIMVVFNDDLVNAKPTTINLAFTGTFQ